ncbi:hypothetical protein BC938DRAFT_474211 [Jimgerdemannia flammicorona]|uniref:GIY-YIG domain-containing protein n=1 Tax=Jimgerdemannia flammicorona TaxID=994334 RepID=A0A433Q2P8_9FUNG|nr:hypothetical protein BC938DRAFT_474211 [Jimgerdemannia flammicorona]
MLFENLNITDNFSSAINSLKGLAGIYAIKCTLTGAIYVGSSTDLGVRIRDHFFKSSNIRLRHAINKYGISSFIIIIVEFIEITSGSTTSSIRSLLLSREQIYLDSLFSTLPKELLYNFLPVAGTSLGYVHTSDTKAKISATLQGKVPANHFQKGDKNPNYGLVAANAAGVLIYDLEVPSNGDL